MMTRPLDDPDPLTGKPITEIDPDRATRILKVRERLAGKEARYGETANLIGYQERYSIDIGEDPEE